MLNAVIQELGENEEEESLASRNISQAAGLEVKYSTPSPKRLSFSPANNYKVYELVTLLEKCYVCIKTGRSVSFFFLPSFLLKLFLSGRKIRSPYFKC